MVSERERATTRRYNQRPSVKAKRRAWEKSEKGRATKRKWRQAHPKCARNGWLKRTYGLTLEQYEVLFRQQAGRCAVCNRAVNAPDVDHDHATKKVRGLLCTFCNIGLGYVEEPDWLPKARNYLTRQALCKS